MRSRDQRKRRQLGFEAMEGRIALSGISGHLAGGHDKAEVHKGADDAAKATGAAKVDDHGHHGVNHK